MLIRTVAPVEGWALDAIVFLERFAPGLTGRFMRGDARRRQSMAAYISTRPWVRGFDPMAEPSAAEADLLMRAEPRELVEAAFGSVPVGYVGALARSGPQPWSRGYCLDLHVTLSHPRKATAAKVVRQLRQVSEAKLLILDMLPPELHLTSVVESLESVEDAEQLTELWALFQAEGVATAEAIHGLRQAARSGEINGFLTRWASHCSCPPHPLPSSSRYKAVMNGHALRAVALRFRNCSRSLLPSLLEGKQYLGVYTSRDGSEVLVEMKATAGGVRLAEIHGHRNRPVEAAVRQEAEAFVRAHGIETTSRTPAKWDALRHVGVFTSRWLF